MRLRTFKAGSMSEAMALVRAELGPDAIMISAEEADGGTTVLAAVESEDVKPGGDKLSDTIHAALINHGVTPRVAERLVVAAASLGTKTEVHALGAALASLFRFAPIKTGRIALVGTPGAGKTLTCAKIATRAVLAGQAVHVITTDTVRAGATEQLGALTGVLGIDLLVADGPDELNHALSLSAADELTLIDTAGMNPYVDDDREELEALLACAGAEPVFVIAAGSDVYDTVELAREYAGFGCRRMIATRVDMAHRLGGLLVAADAAQLALAELGLSPSVADGLRPMSPAGLARLLLPEATPEPTAAPAPVLENLREAS